MKQRVDLILVQRGLADSREKAKALVMSGKVFCGDRRIDKAGETLSEEAVLEVRGTEAYVSRGGRKLEKAISTYEISLNGKVCADIGASTGGFTDCMLQNGAQRVYAVDVGYGQLAWKLRTDARVVSLERTNARYLSRELIAEEIEFFSVDVSFISLSLVLPAICGLLSDTAQGVLLVKPQFEAGRGKVGKNGVVRDPNTHLEVLQNAAGYVRDNGMHIAGLTWSPIRGPKGNMEYLAFISTISHATAAIDTASVVEEAHKFFEERGAQG